MKNLSLLFLLLVSVATYGAESGIIHSIPSPGSRRVLSYEGNEFYVNRGETRTKIENAFVDAKLRNITLENFAKLRGHVYFKVSEMSDGSYSLRMIEKGLGGGYFCAEAAYITTKTVLTAAYAAWVAGRSAAIGASGTWPLFLQIVAEVGTAAPEVMVAIEGAATAAYVAGLTNPTCPW